MSSLQRLAPFSCSGHPSLAVEGLLPVVWSNPWAESPSSPHCSVLPAVSLGFTRVGFYKRMKSSLLTIKREPRGAHPFSFSAAAGWPQGKHSPAASRERGGAGAWGPGWELRELVGGLGRLVWGGQVMGPGCRWGERVLGWVRACVEWVGGVVRGRGREWGG